MELKVTESDWKVEKEGIRRMMDRVLFGVWCVYNGYESSMKAMWKQYESSIPTTTPTTTPTTSQLI